MKLPTARSLWWQLLILLPALAAMAANVTSPLRGNFYFRQGHVMANERSSWSTAFR